MFLVGDDIQALTAKDTKWYQKAGAGLSLASNFIPGIAPAKFGVKGAIVSAKAAKNIKTAKIVGTSLKNQKTLKVQTATLQNKNSKNLVYQKKVNKGTDKAEILATNKKAGAAAEKLAEQDLVRQGNQILGSQVSVRTSAGIRRIDHLIKDSSGNIKAIEVKAGNARRNASQLKKDTLLETEGGVIIGKNAPEGLVGKLRKIPTSEMRY